MDYEIWTLESDKLYLPLYLLTYRQARSYPFILGLSPILLLACPSRQHQQYHHTFGAENPIRTIFYSCTQYHGHLGISGTQVLHVAYLHACMSVRIFMILSIVIHSLPGQCLQCFNISTGESGRYEAWLWIDQIQMLTSRQVLLSRRKQLQVTMDRFIKGK